MKMIVAILRPDRLKGVEDRLKESGFPSLTEFSVRGRGKTEGYHHRRHALREAAEILSPSRGKGRGCEDHYRDHHGSGKDRSHRGWKDLRAGHRRGDADTNGRARRRDAVAALVGGPACICLKRASSLGRVVLGVIRPDHKDVTPVNGGIGHEII